ncbi:acyltransferase [Micrococcus luteus]|uniref:acyltransferase n=1 Tax=Micrococcus luteus TaxID=1270 RepID=UPI00380F7122
MARAAALQAKATVDVRRDPVAFTRALGADIGERSRLFGISKTTFGSEPYLITLDDHVTVAADVQFVTHDGGVWVLRDEHPDLNVFGRIVVGDDVFIGVGSLIMPGVIIGDNVVIGAHSVVTWDTPSDSVAVSSPANVVTSLDEYRRRSLEKGLHTKGLDPEE